MTEMASDHSSVSPPALSSGASSTQKRETLTSRAKRIIGRGLDVSEEVSNTSESSSRGLKVRKTPTRRREQVLQAQRTHRQRTQGYIRELEKEVLRLRDSETALKSENARLKGILSQNGILVSENASPAGQDGSASPEDPICLLSEPSPPAVGDASSIGSVRIDLTALNTFENEKWCSVTSAMQDTRPFELPTISQAQLFDYGCLDGPIALREGSDGNYGPIPAMNAQAAIDFVLELERPCLGHVKNAYSHKMQFAPLGGRAAPDFNHGPHHVFTTASGLLHCGFGKDPINEPFSMPISSLEKLFQTSLSLNLGDDVTPVQIWANIRRIATKIDLDITMLRQLKFEFMKYARCNSFGSVVHRDIVDAIFDFFFPGERFVPIWS
ncbi:uncharacterized protein PV09_01224 [Verruconis gallopava]|uniref:BZIP domain-containing protein n=1 Tax=Verruconis gallopava TaxID=253628 RepID=A0A0D1XZS1_9PEZI|nr:uncharacterized protein PV09_01224 [Verruconis gallopava]KIW08306.1 hypothetical protein PV09_01224 [Verruconis gallopava]